MADSTRLIAPYSSTSVFDGYPIHLPAFLTILLVESVLHFPALEPQGVLCSYGTQARITLTLIAFKSWFANHPHRSEAQRKLRSISGIAHHAHGLVFCPLYRDHYYGNAPTLILNPGTS